MAGGAVEAVRVEVRVAGWCRKGMLRDAKRKRERES